MAIITINGVELPAPSDLSVGIQDISKAERNANGTMIIERIATKRKIEISWKLLTAEDLSKVLMAVSPVLFSVTYPDPQEGTEQTGTFYAGDRNCGMYDYRDGAARYKDVKFSMIER